MCSTQKSHVVLLSASFAFSLLISNGYSQKQGASQTWFTETRTQRQHFVLFCFAFKLCTLSDFEMSVMLLWPLHTAPPQLKEAALKEWFLQYRNVFYWKTHKLEQLEFWVYSGIQCKSNVTHMLIIYFDKRLCSVFNHYLISIPLIFRVDLLILKGEALFPLN